MTDKPAGLVADLKLAFFLLALVVVSVGLNHYFGVPIRVMAGVVVFSIMTCIAYQLYKLHKINQEAKSHIDAVMAQAYIKEKELRDYAQAKGVDLSGVPSLQERIVAAPKQTELAPLNPKHRFWLLVCPPIFGLFGWMVLSWAIDYVLAGVLTYSSKGPPKITHTVTASDNALQFYTQVGFLGSMGMFALTISIAVLLISPAAIFPSIDVAYRKRMAPFLKRIFYLGLVFGVLWLLLLGLRPIIL